jgi:hypothetical protein
LPRNRKTVEATLQEKGFAKVEGDHHYFVYLARDGRKTRARTKTSHSPKVKDIADNLLGQMARQCMLTKPDFLKLVDCPMSREEYERKLTDRGEIQVGDEPNSSLPSS